MRPKELILCIILIIIVGTGYFFAQLITTPINSFEECVAAGNPIMESYPEQCRTPNGKIFVRKYGDTQAGGGIKGIVMLGPTCPVMMNPPDPDCADRPFETTLVVTTADGTRELKQFTSDLLGKFQVELTPGQYAIRSAAIANVLPHCASDGIIDVAKEAYTEIVVSCDSGIR